MRAELPGSPDPPPQPHRPARSTTARTNPAPAANHSRSLPAPNRTAPRATAKAMRPPPAAMVQNPPTAARNRKARAAAAADASPAASAKSQTENDPDPAVRSRTESLPARPADNGGRRAVPGCNASTVSALSRPRRFQASDEPAATRRESAGTRT